MNAKHKENDEEDIQEQSGQRTAFTADILIDLVNDLKTTISKKKVFTTAMREEISSYRFNISEGSKELEVLQSIFDGLTKNGNAEKFYSKYYANIALHATTYFPELSRNSSTLLATKLADRLLAYRKESLSPVDIDEIKKPLQEKEISGLQYLGGYVLQNLHNKHRASKNWKSTESQQAMSLLTACKEESSKINESQKLINPTKKAQKIFTRAEHYFRNNKTGQCQRFININIMVENCCKDTEVVAFFNDIVSECHWRLIKELVKICCITLLTCFYMCAHFHSQKMSFRTIKSNKSK